MLRDVVARGEVPEFAVSREVDRERGSVSEVTLRQDKRDDSPCIVRQWRLRLDLETGSAQSGQVTLSSILALQKTYNY